MQESNQTHNKYRLAFSQGKLMIRVLILVFEPRKNREGIRWSGMQERDKKVHKFLQFFPQHSFLGD
jgi:hypothetical protein